MPDRTRPIRKEICLNEQELSMVRHKMNQLGTRNFGAYARKMLIDGYIIKVDCAEQKKLASPPLPFVPSNPIPSHRDRGASASRLSSVRLLFSPNAVASSFGVGSKRGVVEPRLGGRRLRGGEG